MARDLTPRFSTSYEVEPGQVTEQRFHTKEKNDEFADGLSFMQVTSITKSYYDPLAREWYPYTDRIFYTQNL